MIRQLRGTVAHASDTSLIIDVNGIGYLVNTVAQSSSFPIGSTQTLYTYLAVRENALDLYGFLLLDELEIFELLIELPKIGPKSARQILTQANVELIRKAVRDDDPTYLAKMSGIGKKSAEKIVAGLKEKITDLYISDAEGTPDKNTAVSDAIDALIALGYRESDARKVVAELPPEITSTNEAVREALKLLS